MPISMPNRTKICKGCGEKIEWCEMASGSKMPLNTAQQMVQVKDGIGEVILVHMPHWATCTKAEDFKKK